MHKPPQPAATPAVPSTPHLPDELLSLIFEALWDSLRFYDNGEVRLDLGTTAAEFVGPCRLVSTRWNSLALPVLIKSVRTKKPAMLLELAQRYDLSHQVKELVIVFEHLDQSLFDVVFPALEVLNAPAVAIDNFDAFSISFPSALVARIICARDALSVNQMTFAHLQLPPLLRSLYMSMNRAGLIELPGFLSAQQASELELLEIEVSYPPSSRSAAYTTATDALRQIDAICDSRGIVLAHNLSVPEVVPHWRPQLTEQPAQEDEQWRWYSEAVEPENAPWPTQRDPWAPPLFEELPTEDFTSSSDDSLDYDAEDDEQFAPFWSEEKRKEVFGHNGSVDGTEDARTSSATAEGKS
ncbi:hypothetical protein JCM10049v2_000125 [Rhodotorula toruloides]